MKSTWIVIWAFAVTAGLAVALTYFLSRPSGVKDDSLYKQIESELVVLRKENDSLKAVTNQPIEFPAIDEQADSLILTKLDKTLYEINKLRSAKPVIDDSDLRKFFSELYLYTERQP